MTSTSCKKLTIETNYNQEHTLNEFLELLYIQFNNTIVSVINHVGLSFYAAERPSALQDPPPDCRIRQYVYRRVDRELPSLKLMQLEWTYAKWWVMFPRTKQVTLSPSWIIVAHPVLQYSYTLQLLGLICVPELFYIKAPECIKFAKMLTMHSLNLCWVMLKFQCMLAV